MEKPAKGGERRRERRESEKGKKIEERKAGFRNLK